MCRHVDHIRRGLVKLQGAITAVKDRLQGPTHDVLVNIVYKDMVCEVQFHLAAFYNLKTFAHGPYEVTRAQDDFGRLALEPFALEEWRRRR